VPPPLHRFRTGRFHCELEGRRCTVIDTGGDSLQATVIEWRELLDAIVAAAAAQRRQRRKGPHSR